MRPITSEIDSAPHRLAKRLAQSLSKKLGCISSSHLKNSNDLIQRLKTSASSQTDGQLWCEGLFTNVPKSGALVALDRALTHIPEEDLPTSKDAYKKLVTLCLNFTTFTSTLLKMSTLWRNVERQTHLIPNLTALFKTTQIFLVTRLRKELGVSTPQQRRVYPSALVTS